MATKKSKKKKGAVKAKKAAPQKKAAKKAASMKAKAKKAQPPKVAAKKSVAKKAATKKAAPAKGKAKKTQPPKAVLKKSPAKKAAPKNIVKKAAVLKVPIAKQKVVKPVFKAAGKKAGATNWSLIVSPLDDRLVIELTEESNVTPGGIFIPDMVEDKPQTGVVVAVGRGHRDSKGRVRPMDVKVGDRVLFPKFNGDTIEINGQKLLILREGDVLGVTGA